MVGAGVAPHPLRWVPGPRMRGTLTRGQDEGCRSWWCLRGFGQGAAWPARRGTERVGGVHCLYLVRTHRGGQSMPLSGKIARGGDVLPALSKLLVYLMLHAAPDAPAL